MFRSSDNHTITSRALHLRERGGADPACHLPSVQPGKVAGYLVRRGWIVVLLAAVGGAALYQYAKELTPTYKARGSVYVSSQAPQILNIQAVAPEESRDLEQMRSVEQGMRASTLLLRVIEKHDLAADPDFVLPGSGQEAMLDAFSRRVEVGLRRGTRIIDLAVEDTNPARARELVESLVEEYEEFTKERQLGITRLASEGLAREEATLRERMETSARELREFREKNPVPGLEGDGHVRDELGTLTSQLTQARAERLRLESGFEAFGKLDADDPNSFAGLEGSERAAEVLAQVRAIQQKEAEFGRVKERYLEKHPVYKEIENEIGQLRRSLSETVRSAGQALEQRYRVAMENESKLLGEVGFARESAIDVESLREEFRRLSRDAEAHRTLHESVAQRLRETSLAMSVPASVLRWEAQPILPEKPSGPRKKVYAASGVMGGFLMGVVVLAGMAASREFSVKDPDAAARATGSPLLVTIPPSSGGAGVMVALEEPSSGTAEAFRRLSTLLSSPEQPEKAARTVIFTSAKEGEGKSFCALHYATALAIQGHRTLLLDADMTCAGLSADHLNGETKAGLGGYLSGKNDPASACFATALPNLYMLSSGPVREDSAELLRGTRFPALLEDAFRWFDRVVIDSPPAVASGDLPAMARYADGCCLVVKDAKSDQRELRRAADLVRSSGGDLRGFLWNQLPRDASPGAPVVTASYNKISSVTDSGIHNSRQSPISVLPRLA